MKKTAEIQRIDVVLLGGFNPNIFSPAWLSAQSLIGENDAENATIEIIVPDISLFHLPWCTVQVTRERFLIFTEQEAYFGILFDLVANIFKTLEHTPIHTLGYNWGMHLKCDSEEEYHNFGHYLVPQNPWRGIFDDSALLKLEMTEKKLSHPSLNGKMQIRVESSEKTKPGIFINTNHHYTISEKQALTGCREILDIFENNWEPTRKKTVDMVSKLIDNYLEDQKNGSS